MAGVKGRSGRRTCKEGEVRRYVIQKSWEIVKDFLNSEQVSLKEKIETAKQVAIKDMPSSPLIDQSKHFHITYGHRPANRPVRGQRQSVQSAQSDANESVGMGGRTQSQS